MKKLAFVAPWYGEYITGGAEMELRDLVHHLRDAGMELEVLTTCVKDFTASWNINYHPEGVQTEKGITIRRFPVRARDTEAFDRVNGKLMQGEKVKPQHEEIYFRESVNSPELYRYIARHREEYALFVFIPYLFGTTFYGIQQCPDKSAVIPCLHDEGYAHLMSLRKELAKVKGMIFNAAPEAELAKRLIDLTDVKTITMGIGMNIDAAGDPARFREKFGIDTPFILYAGRKDAGKNVDTLLQYFAMWKKRCPSDTKLVLIGGGKIGVPLSVKSDVVDLGFVSPQDKYDACAASLLLCQPSQHESFSLVIMESWLCGRPVLVSGKCDVTKNFAVESGGGLYFSNYPEFERCVEYLRTHEDAAAQMGQNGGDYVRENFAWPVIVERYRTYFEQLTGDGV